LCQYLHITVLAYLFEDYLPSKTACQNPQEYSVQHRSVLPLFIEDFPQFFAAVYYLVPTGSENGIV
jgi:hypothetical protein